MAIESLAKSFQNDLEINMMKYFFFFLSAWATLGAVLVIFKLEALEYESENYNMIVCIKIKTKT